jgi:hypothetical protein
VRPVCEALLSLFGGRTTNVSVLLERHDVLLEIRRELDLASFNQLPPPLGFLRAFNAAGARSTSQHEMGPDWRNREDYRGTASLASTACAAPRHCSSLLLRTPRPPPMTSDVSGAAIDV